MAPDEICEAEDSKQVKIQKDDPKPEGDNNDNVEMNADEIQDDDDQSIMKLKKY